MSEFNKLEALTEDVKQYLKLNVEILKLEAISHVSTLGSSLLSSLILSVAVILFLFSASLALGFYLSALLGDTFSGFAIVAAFYLLLSIVLFAIRKKIIERQVRDNIIAKILEDKES